MKRLMIILIMVVCIFSGFLAVLAAKESPKQSGPRYPNVHELFAHWERKGYPDYIGGVYSTDGSSHNLTILLVGDNGRIAKQIRASLFDDTGLSFGKAVYSYNTLKAVQNEITDKYLGSDKKIYSVGLGGTGFGKSGNEPRVTVGVDESVLTEYTDKFYELYGDGVVVEAGSPAVLL